jgi:hypothetical protein
MATSMKIGVFWDVAMCSLVDTDRSFRRAYCRHHQGDGNMKNTDLKVEKVLCVLRSPEGRMGVSKLTGGQIAS